MSETLYSRIVQNTEYNPDYIACLKKKKSLARMNSSETVAVLSLLAPRISSCSVIRKTQYKYKYTNANTQKYI